MSITQMTYNERTSSLEISIKFFTDDLEKAVEEENKVKLNLGTQFQHEKAKELLSEYLNQKFIVKQVNVLAQDFLGMESEYDYTYCYIEIKNFKPKSDFSVTHTALMEIFPDQLNKINFSYVDKNISLSSTRSKTTQIFQPTD